MRLAMLALVAIVSTASAQDIGRGPPGPDLGTNGGVDGGVDSDAACCAAGCGSVCAVDGGVDAGASCPQPPRDECGGPAAPACGQPAPAWAMSFAGCTPHIACPEPASCVNVETCGNGTQAVFGQPPTQDCILYLECSGQWFNLAFTVLY